MRDASRAVVPGDHPCLAGHFPGRPVVPGVLILELVVQAARAAIGPMSLTSVRAAKFLSPLLPDETAEIQLEWTGGQVHFRCECGGRTIAKGTLEYT